MPHRSQSFFSMNVSFFFLFKTLLFSPLFSLLITFSATGQAVTPPKQALVGYELPVNYPFVNQSFNNIENDTCLKSVYDMMYRQRMTNEARISMVHIGDSHIQADMMTSVVRENIQRDFGNAGRGLITPYRVAGTNEPINYYSSSNASWTSARIIQRDAALPIGVSGLTIRASQAGANLRIKTLDRGSLDYSFDQAIVFYDRNEASCDVAVCDSSGHQVYAVQSRLQESTPNTATVFMANATHEINLKSVTSPTGQNAFQVYGVSLEKGGPGVLYHAIGINGATYQNYAGAEHFAPQLGALYPDLIVISMGTNEAQGTVSKATFMQQIDGMVKDIRQHSPQAAILLTVPADSYRQQKVNPSFQTVRDAIANYALNNHIAYWNLYDITSGYGSAEQWRKFGLLGKDGVHYTKNGYELQGQLLYQAIINGYNRYVIAQQAKEAKK